MRLGLRKLHHIPQSKYLKHCDLGAVSYDVSSMYPTMINVHNISTDTDYTDGKTANP